MKIKFKVIFSAVLSFLLAFCLTANVYAQARYSDSNKISLSLTYSSSKGAICSGNVTGASGTTSITNCNVYLLDSSGNVVSSWTNLSSSTSSLYFTKYYSSAVKGNTYTLYVTATVKRNGTSESVSDSLTCQL